MNHYLLDLQLLLLLITANGTPILAGKLLGGRWSRAIDAGHCAWDQRPWFGPSKTWRGLLSAVVITVPLAMLLGLEARLGLYIVLGAMAGDLLSSFIKRRLDIAASGQALGLDQIPESLLPLLLVGPALELVQRDLVVLVGAFFVLELGLSRILYALHIRKRPY